MSEMMFHIGDRVKIASDFFFQRYIHITPDEDGYLRGTVCHLLDGLYPDERAVGIRFDERHAHDMLHTCSGHCDNHHGWYVSITQLLPITDEGERNSTDDGEDISPLSDDVFSSMFGF